MYHRRRKKAPILSAFSQRCPCLFLDIFLKCLRPTQVCTKMSEISSRCRRTPDEDLNDTKQWHRDEHFTKMVLDLEWPCNYRPNQSGTSRISGINGQFDRQLTEGAVYGGRKEMPYGICMQYKTVCHDFVQIFIRSMPQRITTCIQNINWGKRVYWMFCQLLPKVCICRLTFFSLYSVLFFFVCGAETTGCNMHWCRFTRLLHR